MIRRDFFAQIAVASMLVAFQHGEVKGDEHRLAARFEDRGVTVYAGDSPVLTFQCKPKSLDGEWERASYIHPLHDLGGEIITEDFPADHRHHRGIFWAWHQVLVGSKQLGDAWLCKDFQWEMKSIEATTPSRGMLTLKGINHWKSAAHVDGSGNPIAIAEEKSVIKVHVKTEHYRVIDIDLSLIALVDDVKIGGSDDAKGYGGFSPRIKMEGDERFLSESGELNPTKLSMQAGTWVNITRQERGIAFLVHRDNPQVSEKSANWILRRGNSMQNAVYPGRKPAIISKTQPTHLRYRMVIHDGSIQPDTLNELQSSFWETAR